MENVAKKHSLSKGANLTPFEEADKKLIAFAERAIFYSKLNELVDRLSTIEKMEENPKLSDERKEAIEIEKQIIDAAIVVLLEAYDDLIHEA